MRRYRVPTQCTKTMAVKLFALDPHLAQLDAAIAE
jgi:hypothetical protein